MYLFSTFTVHTLYYTRVLVLLNIQCVDIWHVLLLPQTSLQRLNMFLQHFSVAS